MARKVGLVACAVLAVAAIAGGIALLTRGSGEERTSVAPSPVRRPPPVLRAVRESRRPCSAGQASDPAREPRRARADDRWAAHRVRVSPDVLGRLRKGPWLAVRSSALGNSTPRLGARADASRLLQRHAEPRGRPVRARAARPTTSGSCAASRSPSAPPTLRLLPGRFYVTDKLPGVEFGSYYGCCILALSGRQPNLPEGWSGGDRLAIHGSPTPTWGHAVSNGCLHAAEPDLRYLMKTVPLGTAVRIHA